MFRKIRKKIIYCLIVTVVNIAFGEKGWSAGLQEPQTFQTYAIVTVEVA